MNRSALPSGAQGVWRGLNGLASKLWQVVRNIDDVCSRCRCSVITRLIVTLCLMPFQPQPAARATAWYLVQA